MIAGPWLQLINGDALEMRSDGTMSYHDFGEARLGPDDAAHSLALLNRYNGHSRAPYSVAQHSVHVSQMLDFDCGAALYGLLHDLHEIAIGDIPTPLKQRLAHTGPNTLDTIEAQVQRLLLNKLGVLTMPSVYAPFVVRADRVALATEKRDLMAASYSWGDWLAEYPPQLKTIKPLPWRTARAQFIKRYDNLVARCKAANLKVFCDVA